MPSLALGNSHFMICQWSCLLWSEDTLSAYGDSASDRQMDASSNLSNIVDQSDPHHDYYKDCEIVKLYVFVFC